MPSGRCAAAWRTPSCGASSARRATSGWTRSTHHPHPHRIHLDFRKDYLGWHIHYHLGADEKRGLAKFIELLRRHGCDPIFEPRFVV